MPPEKASEPKQRCLAMINEFGDKVCSLPESHGGPHNWVLPERDNLGNISENGNDNQT